MKHIINFLLLLVKVILLTNVVVFFFNGLSWFFHGEIFRTFLSFIFSLFCFWFFFNIPNSDEEIIVPKHFQHLVEKILKRFGL